MRRGCGRQRRTSTSPPYRRPIPATIPTWNELLRENDPGTFTAPIPVPLLIIQGGADEQIPVASTQLLFGQLCAIGQVEQRWVYPDQSHAGVVPVSLDDMLTWIGDRFAGDPAPDPYQPVGPPAPETQSCPTELTPAPGGPDRPGRGLCLDRYITVQT